MNTERPTLISKGCPSAVVALDNGVEVWISSPTGDSSDSHIFLIPTNSRTHSETIAKIWQTVWALAEY